MTEPRRVRDLAEAVTITDCARLLGVSPRTVQRFVRASYLAPFYLPGSGRPRIPVDQVVRLRSNTTPPRRRRGLRQPPARRRR